ncbi:MAG: aminotransferase class V-fold PLP-dependent enzyme [Bdellovibrionota bacterium]
MLVRRRVYSDIDFDPLGLSKPVRSRLWRQICAITEGYHERVPELPVAPELDPGAVRDLLKRIDFNEPMDPAQAMQFAAHGLSHFQTHAAHPGYFGLFNPSPTAMGIAADALVAAFNPQVGSWSGAPFAVEVEQYLIRFFGGQFGYGSSESFGTFTSGGSEANHTALLTALARRFPEFNSHGVRGISSQPVIYVSKESHHTHLRAARLCGLGDSSIRRIPVGPDLQMNSDELKQQVFRDRRDGLIPLMVIATAGTTNAGVIDPIAETAEIAKEAGAWFHLDAAWGGAAALVPELKYLFRGANRADSITFDAHKWLSVPMGAGMYLTRHRDILEKTFRINTPYVPQDVAYLDVVEPYQQSIQWSRRFIGLKLFLSLAVAGQQGYASALRHQIKMANELRAKLYASGWKLMNDTPLPVVCFIDSRAGIGSSKGSLDRIARIVVGSGKAWISTTVIGEAQPVLRACVTNYKTGSEDIDRLVSLLNEAREPR